jgi:tRNA-splicing ligase RtcB
MLRLLNTQHFMETIMKNTDKPSAISRVFASGHPVRSVVSENEPTRHRLKALSDLEAALPRLENIPEGAGSIDAVSTTPDFHAGKPVPVGVVVDSDGLVMPHLIGSDIGCGMRMIALNGVTEDDLPSSLDGHLRHLHFQGGRDIALNGRARHAVLRDGVPGLLEEMAKDRRGLLSRVDLKGAWLDVDRMSDNGAFSSSSIDPNFADYADLHGEYRYDGILGTIGGGNHFVEFGVVDRIEDGQFASVAGVRKGSLVLVVHSGSLDFGQNVGASARQRQDQTAFGDKRVVSLLQSPALAERYLNAHANAANVAFVNRFLIGLTAIEALKRSLGRDVGHHLVYDAPHNTVWRQGTKVRHRKGACPARGPGELLGSPYEWLGEPVILPGSMGDGSWLLKGLGDASGLQSSAHGAGRRLSRQDARSEAIIPAALRVVGPLDLKASSLRGRADILAEAESRLKEEAPAAYRPIESVVNPMVEAGLVGRVAKVRPLLTVKG